MSRAQQILSPSKRTKYDDKVLSTFPANILAYWSLHFNPDDSSGNLRHGVDVGSPTYGEIGIGDGSTSVLLNGASDAINVFTSSFQSAFNGDQGTISAWSKVFNSAVWTDGQQREIVRFLVSGSQNFVFIDKAIAGNTLVFQRRAQSTTDSVPQISSALDWFHVALTWDLAMDEVKGWYNGVQAGVTQTGLLSFAGVLQSTTTMIGAANTSTVLPWHGYVAKVGVWDIALPQGSIENLARIL